MKRYDSKCFTPTITIAILTFVSGYIIAFWSIKSDESIAKKAGHFDRPAPALFMNDDKGNRLGDDSFDHMIVFGDSLRDKRIIRTRIPLIIINEGQKSANNLYVTFRYPKESHFTDFDYSEVITYGREIDIQRTVSVFGDFEYVSYYISKLNPGEILTMSEPIFLPRTELKDTLLIPEVSQEYEVTNVIMAIPVNITLSGDDIETSDYVIEIVALEANSFKHFVSRVKWYIHHVIKPEKTQRSLFALFSRQNKRTMLAEFIQPAYVSEENDILYVQADQDTANLIFFTYK